MRPASIVRFEQAYLASVAVWLINLALGWKTRIATVERNPAFGGNPQMLEFAHTMMVGMSVALFMLWLLLWYFTARRASEVAKWVLVATFACSTIGLPFALMSYQALGALSVALTLLTFALHAVAVWMLFRPDAKGWFRGTAETVE